MKRLFFIGTFALLFAICSYAQSLFEITLQKALAGDSKAQNDIGAYYKEGYGVPQDCDKAIYWYHKSAQQNDPVGLYGLGQCYAIGCGVQQDMQIAANYILRAAQKGVKEAQRTMGYMYQYGWGVQQNAQTAQYWFNQANK